MPLLHCKKCHHEWEGRANSKCDWCAAEGRILKLATELAIVLEKLAKERKSRHG